LFDVNREARLVQPGDSYKVSVSFHGVTHRANATRSRHCEQIPIPRGLRGVAGQRAVGAMIVDEVFYFREEVHGFMRGSVPIDGEIAARLPVIE
jgi:hypothetical protein